MANASLFRTLGAALAPRTDTQNEAGAPAYAYQPAHRLAQLAMTGTFNDGFYGSAAAQLDLMREAAEAVEPRFLAQTAVYARRQGRMKDAPAFLLAVLSRRDAPLFHRAFDAVVDDGRMLRSFVQIMRSGAAGRTSLGSAAKRRVQDWLNAASDRALLNAAVGGDPSLTDVIRMVHPRPASPEREALFAWIIGRPCAIERLPEAVRDLIRFRADGGPTPDAPFQLLTSAPLTAAQWAEIAERASWRQLRMNLNTFIRQGVFALRPDLVAPLAAKLADPEAIRRAGAMPYELLAAAGALDAAAPQPLREAIVAAMEVAVSAAPRIAGRVVVCPDVSGSMGSPATGWRRGATSVVRCVDVAALVAAAMLRVNRQAEVMPFDTAVRRIPLRASDSVLTNAERLAANGGGTDCTAPLRALNARRAKVDLVLFVSDNQSWAHQGDGRTTPMMREWAALKQRNPAARMVCVDIAPYGTTQAPSAPDVLNVGGFSDAVFDVVAGFAEGRSGGAYWTDRISEIAV